MPEDFYRLPLRLDLIVQGPQVRQLPRNDREVTGTLESSIDDHLYLLITTQFREARFDPKFGSIIWEEDFTATSESKENDWTESIYRSVKDGIRQYEPRLEKVEVYVDMDREGSGSAHKRLLIRVTAEIRKSNHRRYEFRRAVLIAPFASKPR
jgi:phage baseplate assembly protein W